jgi:hypothetical protein
LNTNSRPAPHLARTTIALFGAYTAANLSWFTQPFQFTVFSTQSGFGSIAAGWILSSEIGLAALVSIAMGYFSGARTSRPRRGNAPLCDRQCDDRAGELVLGDIGEQDRRGSG